VNLTHFNSFISQGDPFDTSVILWTRAVPLLTASGEGPDQSVPACVEYRLSTNSDLSGPIISQGEAYTSGAVDWTVKVEARGLKPDTQYFYRFSDCTNPSFASPIGTTRTIANSESGSSQPPRLF